MTVSLIIPTLNERASLPILFEGLSAAQARLIPEHRLEVIIVDDGSADGTAEEARTAQTPFDVRVIERKERGLATAVLRGFTEARGEILGVMDADLSHPTELIPEMIAAMDKADLVVASRNLPGGSVEEWPWYRVLASRFATLLVRPFGVRCSDPMSGYFFLRRGLLENRPLSPIGYKILLEILVKSEARTIREIPYVFRNREVGKSKMGLGESVNYLRHLARLARWKWGKRTS